jgi:hypothetical protein
VARAGMTTTETATEGMTATAATATEAATTSGLRGD